MKVEYDVKIPHNTGGYAPYADVFWKFYESEHVSVKLEYDEVNEAVKCQKAVDMLMSRHKIHNIFMTRRKNVLYMIRSDAHADGCNG